ncbi:MAG: hypothetical protein ACFFBP_04905 [Promethearchaeota archaeon]
MKFCPECDNLLGSKNKTLFCRTCGLSFEIKDIEKKDYLLIKQMKNDESELKPYILKKEEQKRNIANEYRRAYEDYFASSD